jgi:hypothetical protein
MWRQQEYFSLLKLFMRGCCAFAAGVALGGTLP